MPFLTFLANVFRSGTPESFGRLSALPFLQGSCALSVYSGFLKVRQGQSPNEEIAFLSATAFAMFGSGKYLDVKAAAVQVQREATETSKSAGEVGRDVG